MLYSAVAAALTAFGLLVWYWSRSRRSISHLPGPSSDSWLVGNVPDFQRAEEAGVIESDWAHKYGNAFRIKGCFGEDILYLSDPRGMQYVMNKSGYNFPKTWEVRIRQRLTTGRGIVAAHGAEHARHRRVMNPSFSHSALRGYLPLFFDISRRTTTAWKAMIRARDVNESVIDVSSLLACTTLDALGEAAFGYKFNSIGSDGPKTKLHQAYRNLFVDISYMPPNSDIIFRRLLAYAPLWISDLSAFFPKKYLRRLDDYMAVARHFAKDIVDKQSHAVATGKEGGKDVMSILIKANNAEDPKRQLKEDEILAQITSLMIAGHETTANALSWTLYELSQHPEVQRKLRDEVKSMRAEVDSREDSEITIADLDSMRYISAVVKETLRYHPTVLQIFRQAGQDDIIPLDKPQRTVSGEIITSIPVRRGQEVQLALAAYNRLKRVWGQDADQWRPERFLEGLPKENMSHLGVFDNLLSNETSRLWCKNLLIAQDLHSAVACAAALGAWRFSMIEMQAVLFELMENFEFNLAPGVQIRRASCILMQSMVKGQEHKGTQMPLKVSIIS